MTTHGIIEQKFAGSIHAVQEYFVNLVTFFSSAPAGLGIQQVASQYGFGPLSGSGLGYWDGATTNTASANAFVVYKFSLAANPFYMLLQYGDQNSVFGAFPGNPGTMTNSSIGVGVSFAISATGGNPWNGTMSNNGTDHKGTPVWKTTLTNSNDLLCWPRINSIRGTTSGSAQSMMTLMNFSDVQVNPSRAHCIVDADHVFFAVDPNLTGGYQFLFFGKYNPINYVTVPVPYVAICHGDQTHGIISGTSVGSTGIYGNYVNPNAQDGGIAHPDTTRGVKAVGLSWYACSLASGSIPTFVNGFQEYDELSIALGSLDFNQASFGYLGNTDGFMSLIANINTLDTNQTSNRIAFGPPAQGHYKVTVPWNSGTVPGSGIVRAGITF